MLNAPITGDDNLDSFLFAVQNEITSPTGVSVNPSTGTIYDIETGVVVSYLYKYIHVKYADDNIGTGMSTSETGKTYFGVQNTDSATASTAPADYTWYLTVGFGGLNHLYYLTSGGRQIRWYVGSTGPSGYTLVGTVTAGIDLDSLPSVAGTAGISSIMAYKIQSQSAAIPTFSATTAGNAVPSGWSSTAGSVAVGQVIWYIFGRYNSAAVTVDGVPANTTSWGGLTAASVSQDIRSDNWNGSNPPTFSNPATWGTAGYYIRRDDGTIIANNLGARGTLQSGTAVRSGSTMTGSGANLQSDGTFAIGKPGASIVNDGSDIYIKGFINDLLVGVAPFPSSGSTASYTNVYTSPSVTIKNGKYSCNVSGGISMSVLPTAFRRIYTYVQFTVNINGSDTFSQSSGNMIPVANAGSAYTHTQSVSLARHFDLSGYTGGTVYLRVTLGVVCHDIVTNATYTEIVSIDPSNVVIDVREYNT